jgi:hypothetical protein
LKKGPAKLRPGFRRDFQGNCPTRMQEVINVGVVDMPRKTGMKKNKQSMIILG